MPSNPITGDPFANFRAPSPPREPEEKLHGFTPFDPSTSNIPIPSSANAAPDSLSPEQLLKAQKYIKYAGSALTYDDVPTAIENLQKSLRLLTTGQDS
jgi:vacuolar protein sorting-associated protein VTA1